MKALLLEDDYCSNTVIANELREIGFHVDLCFDGDTAMDIVHDKGHDLYILDINVPGFDGNEVLEYIRHRYPNALVIMISTHIEIEFIKKAFSLGCQDYLKKPFEMEELLLRIKNLTRLLNPDKNEDRINLSQGYTFTLNNNQLFHYGKLIELTRIESLLLRILIQNIGNIVTNETLREYVWNSDEVAPATMRYWVHRLLKKLKNGMIVNTRGVGYRLRKLD